MEDSTANTGTKRKRQYAAHRVTKSVRKSETPGVQVLSLKEDGMPEIKQTAYRKLTLSHNYQSVRDPKAGTDSLEISSATEPELARRTADRPMNKETFLDLEQTSTEIMLKEMYSLARASSIIRDRDPWFDDDRVVAMHFAEHLSGCDYRVAFFFWSRLPLKHRFPMRADFRPRRDRRSSLLDMLKQITHLGKKHEEVLYRQSESSQILTGLRSAILASNTEAMNEILARENEITEAYNSGKHERIAEKLLGFVALCGRRLREAQERHDVGDSSLLNLLLEHNVPEKWWKTGWQKYLDHLWSTGNVHAVESYIQEACVEVNRLRTELPVLEKHWEKCLDGLGEYERRLRRRYDPGQPRSPHEKDDKGGGHGLVHFASQWTVPLSTIGSTVLMGWHLIGTRVSHEVYKRVGYIFCTIDLKWVWSG